MTAHNRDTARAPRLVDDVWCVTCKHTHIPYLPAVTFRCADCGFGAWSEWVAVEHAELYRDHVVYPQHHVTVPT